MRQQIPLLGDQSVNRNIRVNNQTAINLEPHIEKPNARTQLGMYSTPGLALINTAGDGVARSNWVKFKNKIYYVNGSKLISVDTSDVATEVGTLSTSTGWCVLAKGRDYLMLVDGTDGYSYDGTTFAVISDADFTANPTHCDIKDGYFIVNNRDSDEFYISALENPKSWNALDFATAEYHPDNILAFAVHSNDLFFIGEATTQPYTNSGNADFPFDPYQESLDVGIFAKYSLAKGSPGLFWLATNEEGDLTVVWATGLSIKMLSDQDHNWQINDFKSASNAIGSLFRHKGNTFYELTFPQDDITFVIDINTGMWHRRKSYNIGRHRAQGFGYLNGKILCGDYANTNFYQLDYDTYTENGDIIERYRRTQVMHVRQQDMIFHELILDMETGVGLVTGQGSDPIIQMRYTDDGYSWSSWLDASMGKIGEYKVRLRWEGLGETSNRIFEFRVTDPVYVGMYNAFCDIEILPY